MSHDLIVHEPEWDDSMPYIAMMNIAIPRIEAIEAPAAPAPFPLLPKHYGILTTNYRIAPPLVVNGPFFSLQDDPAGIGFLLDIELENNEESSIELPANEMRLNSFFEPKFGAIGVSDFDVFGKVIGQTLLGLKPGWESGSPPAILRTTSRFSRVGVYPFTRQLMRNIHPRFPFVWSHDPIQCMNAASYGMPTFHLVSGTSLDHEAHREHLLRDLEALEALWAGAATMPQHLLLGSTLGSNGRDFRAMDLVGSELKRQDIDVIRTTSPYGWSGEMSDCMAALGSGYGRAVHRVVPRAHYAIRTRHARTLISSFECVGCAEKRTPTRAKPRT